VVVVAAVGHQRPLSVTKACWSSRKANGQLLTMTVIRCLQRTAAVLLTILTVGCRGLNQTCSLYICLLVQAVITRNGSLRLLDSVPGSVVCYTNFLTLSGIKWPFMS